MLSRIFSSKNARLGLCFLVGIGISLFGHMNARRNPSSAVKRPQEVIYSDFLHLVSSGSIDSVRFEDGTGRVLFDVKQHPSAERKAVSTPAVKKIPRQFYTRHLPDPQLVSTLKDAGIEFGSVKASFTSGLSRILITTLALWVPLIPMFIIMKKFLEGKGGPAKGKTGNKMKSPRVTFADVAGVDAAKEELQEVVACLRDSTKFSRLGAKLPSGVLLCGPPGTGKTLLAKAVAGEANVPFLAVSASEFVELFVGRGASRIRELFAEARKRAPCVIFIDELDAVGGKRGAGLNEERDQTLNQLLTELDGFEGRPGIVLLAATNRADVLDPALLRPGRLSRKVNVPLPDLDGRANIMMVHLRGMPIEGGTVGTMKAADMVARLGSGLSGAELADVVNEAAFLAARRDSMNISLEDLANAVLRTKFGVNGSQVPKWSSKIQSWLASTFREQEIVKSQPLGS